MMAGRRQRDPGVDFDDDIFRQAVIDHAQCLGIDPEKDANFLWLAEEALLAQLPSEWELFEDEQNNQYYYNHRTGESTWENPLDEPYRQLFNKLRNDPDSAGETMTERQPKGKAWGRFPGEEKVMARARPALEARRRAMASELGLEEKDLNEEPGGAAEAPVGIGSASRKGGATPRPPVPPAGPNAAPVVANADKIESIENHRTVTLHNGEQDLQYLVQWAPGTSSGSDGSPLQEWYSGDVLISEAPALVHEYNNTILCSASGAYTRKLESLRAELEERHREALRSAETELRNEMAQKLAHAQAEKESLEAQLEGKKVLLSQLEEQAREEKASIREECESLREQVAEMTQAKSRDASASVARRMGLEEKLRAVTEEKQALAARLAQLEKDAHAATDESRTAEARAQAADKELLEARESIEQLERDKERAAGDRAVFESMLQNVKKELNDEITANHEVRKRVVELESRLEKCQRDLKRAEEARVTELERERQRVNVLTTERDGVQAELDAVREREREAHASRQIPGGDGSDAEDRIREAVEALRAKLVEAHREELACKESTEVRLRQQMEALEDQLNKSNGELMSAQEALQASERKVNRLESERDVLRGALDKVKGELESEFQTSEGLRKELHETNDALAAASREAKAALKKSEKESSDMERANRELVQRARELQQQLDDIPPSRDAKLEEELATARKESRTRIAAIQGDLERAESKARAAEAELAELRALNEKVHVQLADKESEIAAVQAELLAAREQNESASRAEERRNSERTILEETLLKIKEELRQETEASEQLRQEEAELRTELANMSREVHRLKQAETSRQEQAKAEEGQGARAKELAAELAAQQDKTAALEALLARCRQEMQDALRERDGRAAAQCRELEEKLQQESAASKDLRVAELEAKVEALETTSVPRDTIVDMEREMASLREAAAAHEAQVRETESLKVSLQSLKGRVAQEVKLRRTLHNKLVDLQGNIRVYCRVRPVLEHERRSGRSDIVVEFPHDGEIEVRQSLAARDQEDSFEFDQVFPPDASQTAVFEQVEPLTQSALDGYNVCIFAYGQTGSGKTYTMDGTESDRGVTYRTFKTLFDGIEERTRSAVATYTTTVSVLEIHNETIRDLLDESGAARGKPAPVGAKPKKLEVRKGEDGLFVPGLTVEEVSSIEAAERVMNRGVQNRTVGGHNMNVDSSRSHLVVTVTLVARYKSKGKMVSARSKLHLIDLAGSERLDKTNATGKMLQEAKSINKSLSALGNVIQALGAKSGGSQQQSSQQHVPFRDSKLTFLLQDSLSGNSKVLMFVNISPVEWNAAESICSLTFAARCRKVALGQAKKNTDSAQVTALRKTIEDLQAQLGSRRRQLP